MSLKSPTELPIEHTLEFLGRVLPSGPMRLLDVGCGDGTLARRLQASTPIVVTGIDHSRDAVRSAHDRGIRAIATDFFDYRDDPFDALLFSRSLHHLAPLPKALDTRTRSSPPEAC